MQLEHLKCPLCGAENKLNRITEGGEVLWHCPHCDGKFIERDALREYEKLEATIKSGFGAVIDEALLRANMDKYYNLRSMLWDKVTANYIDSRTIVEICREILSISQHDFLAEFFEIANSQSYGEVAKYIETVDEVKNALFIDVVLDFTIRSMKEEYITPTAALLERCEKIFPPEKKQKYLTRFEAEVKKLSDGIYETALDRDVFLAYSSKDMPKVIELLNLIESNGLTCFAAFRNLQHGRDAVTNHKYALQEAIDHCSIFLFVSSVNSRSFSCYAFSKEIEYIRSSEMQSHPTYRSYEQIPEAHKKLRIEYRLDNKPTPIADRNLKSFFAGLTYVEDYNQLLDRLGECMGTLHCNPEADKARGQEEAKNKAEEEARRKVEEEAKNKAEEEARRKVAEEEAKSKAEDAKQKDKNDADEWLRIATEKARRKLEIEKAFKIEDGVLEGDRNNYFDLNDTIVIPDCVTEIGARAFSNKIVKKVIIPNTVTLIDDNAFVGCHFLKSITFSDNITDIGDSAFYGCNSLTNIKLPKSLTTIGNHAFDGCSSLTEITIPENVEYIGRYAFRWCSRLTQLTVLNGVDSISDNAFESCTSLCNVNIPDSVTSIGDRAFYGCSSLKEIKLPLTIENIGSSAFRGCNLKEVVICEGADVSNYAFDDNVDVLIIEENVNEGYSNTTSYRTTPKSSHTYQTNFTSSNSYLDITTKRLQKTQDEWDKKVRDRQEEWERQVRDRQEEWNKKVRDRQEEWNKKVRDRQEEWERKHKR